MRISICRSIIQKEFLGNGGLLDAQTLSGMKKPAPRRNRSNARGNLAALSKAIYSYLHPDAIDAPVYASFDAAFAEITRLAKNERIVFAIYGITGGVPHYINKLGVRGSVKNALIENFFDTSAYLFEEPENLLKQELREPAIYNSVITAIADGATKLNQISDKTGNDTAICTKYLKSLMELGIVQKRQPIIQKSGRKTTYHISDQFFRFWYRFVPKNMMAIASDGMGRIYDAAVDSYLPSYMGLVFEEICKQYLIYYAPQLPFPLQDIGEWWGAHPKKKERGAGRYCRAWRKIGQCGLRKKVYYRLLQI